MDREIKKFREEINSFVQNEITPIADEWDYHESMPLTAIQKIAERGYLGACIEKKYGGLEWDQLRVGILHEEIGKGCSSLRSLLTVHSALVAETIQRCGTDLQKKYWLPQLASGKKIAAFCLTEENAGSDTQGINGTYKKTAQSYIINCSKKYVTFGESADVFLVFARDRANISAFLVERNLPGVTVVPRKGLLGIRAAMIADISFAEVQVNHEMLVGREAFGLIHVMNSALDNGRYSVALGSLGIAKAAFAACLSHVSTRKQFNSPIKDFQLTKRKITEMATKIEAASHLCYNAGIQRTLRHQDAVIQCCMAKYYTTTIAAEIAREAVQIHGAAGCMAKAPVQRYYRDSKIMEIIEGSSEIQQILIADHILSNNKTLFTGENWN